MCKPILGQDTREYDNIIKYFLTWQDLLYYIGFSIKGRILICSIYDLRGIDFFLSYSINNKRITAEENHLLFSFGDIIQKSLESAGRIEEAKLVLKDLSERKKNISKIVDEFSRKDPEKVLNNLRLYSERFWVDYLGRTTFQKLHPDSKSELIESIVSEELIKKNILTNMSQIALSFCKVIERELNISLFDPFLLEYQNCIINPIPKEISKTQKRKIESRNFTIQACKSCASKEHRLTFGQIVFLMRFWDDKVMNESSNLFHLIGRKVANFSELTKSVNELLDYLELKNDELTLVDIRNSSAHPTIDESINWDENIKWIKKLLGEPPKEILKRIVTNLRKY